MIDGLKPYSAYKDSGVPWLGQVPAHWEVLRLGQIGSLSKGNGGSKEDESPTGVPCIRYGDLYTTHTYFIERSRAFVTPERAKDYTPVSFGDVLFAASGETIADIGKSAVNLIEAEACCGGDVIVFRPEREVVPRYMGYSMDCYPAAAQKASMGRGITVKHIYGDQLKYLTISLAPPAEQSAIVRFLDHADRRIQRYIRTKKKLIALLNEQKQAITHRAVTRGLDPNVQLKPSGVEWLEEVPEHWSMSRVKRLAQRGAKKFTDGDWIEIPYITEQGVRLIQTGNVGIGEYREKGFRYVSEITFNDLRCTEIETGNVLICRLDGPVGRACLAPELGTRMITSVDNVILKVHEGVDPRYVVHVMSSPGWLNWISSICRAGGGFRYRISRSTLGNLTIPLPPTSEQCAIADYLERELGATDVAANRIRAEIDLLHKFRTRLITDVVTGKLDVREAAARLPDDAEEPEALDESEAMGEDEAEDEGADLDVEAVA